MSARADPPRQSGVAESVPVSTPAPRVSRARRLLPWLALALLADQLMVYLGWVLAPVPAAGDRADAAVVLFAGVDAAGVPLPETRRRLDHALELYRHGRVGAILCVGGGAVDRHRPGSRLMRAALLRAGVPAGRVFAGPGSRDTRGNLRAAATLASARGFDHLLVVTSPVHAPRVRYFAHRAGLSGVQLSPWPERARPPLDWAQANRWMHQEVLAWLAWGVLGASVYDRLVNDMRTPPA